MNTNDDQIDLTEGTQDAASSGANGQAALSDAPAQGLAGGDVQVSQQQVPTVPALTLVAQMQQGGLCIGFADRAAIQAAQDAAKDGGEPQQIELQGQNTYPDLALAVDELTNILAFAHRALLDVAVSNGKMLGRQELLAQLQQGAANQTQGQVGTAQNASGQTLQ